MDYKTWFGNRKATEKKTEVNEIKRKFNLRSCKLLAEYDKKTNAISNIYV